MTEYLVRAQLRWRASFAEQDAAAAREHARLLVAAHEQDAATIRSLWSDLDAMRVRAEAGEAALGQLRVALLSRLLICEANVAPKAKPL